MGLALTLTLALALALAPTPTLTLTLTLARPVRGGPGVQPRVYTEVSPLFITPKSRVYTRARRALLYCVAPLIITPHPQPAWRV